MEARMERDGILIVDAGATKADWIWTNGEARDRFRTPGINPFFHSSDDLRRILSNPLLEALEGKRTDLVYYYGAGCSSELHKRRVKEGLQHFFPSAGIRVEHDLLGAARASAGEEPALVAILGTGSNACSFDGQQILEQRGGLGFILGDEGSGAHMGKLLLRDHLNGDLPRELEKAFSKKYPVSREDHIEAVHQGSDPSRYLAGFAPFLKEREEEDWVKGLLNEVFEEFVERHLKSFEGFSGSMLHTVGSIGEHFRPQLKGPVERAGLDPGRSVVDPIEGLLSYHLGP